VLTLKSSFPALIAGLALASAAAMPAIAQNDSQGDVETTTEAAPPQTEGEKRLARLLEGRVAGEPLRCIRTTPNMPMEAIEGTAYVYGRGTTIYVQRTQNPEDIDESDALVSRRFSASEVCKLDVFTTADRVLGFFTGAVFFVDFVPYTKVKDDGKEG
jgi:hypothetical protein